MTTTRFTTRFLTIVAALVAVFGLTVALTGCSNQTVDMTTVTAVIDVRTPDEFAAGHLDGAVNINWEDPTFADQVSTLDKDGVYVLYCRSGNRADQALDAMKSMGFTNVTNVGGVDNASAVTGIAIVQ
ncbi:MAG: rhodanese-like domain-containing protein [Microbacteriaceae bacterium]